MGNIVKVPPRPARPITKSHDDLPAVAALDQAEARLRAAITLANEESKRADEEERKSIELENTIAQMKAISAPIHMIPVQMATAMTAPTVVSPATTSEGKPLSISPQSVTVRGKHWKFTIPITAILSLLPLIFTLASDYSQMKRDFKTQTETFGRITARIEEVNTYAHEVAKSNDDLREKVAELSGYLAGVLPKAGVKVPGAEPGASYVNVISDPLPLGELKKKGKPVIVRTPVPAPAPKNP